MWKIERRPGETKEDAERRSQEEAQARIEEHKRHEDATMRKIFTHWLFWTACGYKRCKRAQACSGDVKRCYDRFWPQVPEEMKVEMRAMIAARAQGLSPHQAVQHAEAEVARHIELQARLAQMSAQYGHAAAPRTQPDPPQPRVRLG